MESVRNLSQQKSIVTDMENLFFHKGIVNTNCLLWGCRTEQLVRQSFFGENPARRLDFFYKTKTRCIPWIGCEKSSIRSKKKNRSPLFMESATGKAGCRNPLNRRKGISENESTEPSLFDLIKQSPDKSGSVCLNGRFSCAFIPIPNFIPLRHTFRLLPF